MQPRAERRGSCGIVFTPYDGTHNLCIRWLIKLECSKRRIWKGRKLIRTFAQFSSRYLLKLQAEILADASWGRYHSVQAEPRALEFQATPKVTPPGNAGVHHWHWPGPKVKKCHHPQQHCLLSSDVWHVWHSSPCLSPWVFLHILHLHSLLLVMSSLGKRNPKLIP